MDHYEELEEMYQDEHGGNDPYTKEGYAKKMHEKELEEMSKEHKFNWKNHIVGHGWNFLAYCREYEEKLKAHESSKIMA